MTHQADKTQIKIDPRGYDYEINEFTYHKYGYFYFETKELLVKIEFSSDEYGNITGLEVGEALDENEEAAEYVIDDSNYKVIADQIEPLLWGDEEYDGHADHGMRNSDFLYGYYA